MADLEDGVYAGGSTAAPATNILPRRQLRHGDVLKGPSGNHFTLKGGDAETGETSRPSTTERVPRGYSPQKKQGAIILGIGGDNSHTRAKARFSKGASRLASRRIPSTMQWRPTSSPRVTDANQGIPRGEATRHEAIGSRTIGGRVEEQLPEAPGRFRAGALGDQHKGPRRVGSEIGSGAGAGGDEPRRRNGLYGGRKAISDSHGRDPGPDRRPGRDRRCSAVSRRSNRRKRWREGPQVARSGRRWSDRKRR